MKSETAIILCIAMWSITGLIFEINTRNLIKENHKITLTQIEKQIDTQTKYIKLLEEVLRGEG